VTRERQHGAAAPGVAAGLRSGRDRWGDETALATLVFPVLVWVVTLATVALVDVGAYLVAAARAQTLADAAALAAVTTDVDVVARGSPQGRAAAVVTAGDGRLEACRCRLGSERASVTVSVAVPGLVLPRLGAGRVAADAVAVVARDRTWPPW
jgi:hypothetical protein